MVEVYYTDFEVRSTDFTVHQLTLNDIIFLWRERTIKKAKLSLSPGNKIVSIEFGNINLTEPIPPHHEWF